MKKIILATVMLLSLQVAFADEYQNFHNAVSFYAQNKYNDARSLFVSCQASGEFDAVNIQIWIDRCDAGIKEQRQNAQAAAAKYKKELNERKKNNFVYLSVNTAENGVLFSSTESALSNILRAKGRHFHTDITKASSIVTVNIDIERRTEDKFFIATVSGTIRYGDAINIGQYDGQASYTLIEGRSVSSMEDAIDRALQVLNKEFGNALSKVLSGQPLVEEDVILDNSIVIKINSTIDENKLTDLRNAINFYVDRDGKYHRNATVDPSVIKALEEEYLRQSKMTARKERSKIGEQKGIRYMLYIDVSQRPDHSYFFSANIFDMDMGYSVASSPEQGYSYKNIYTLDKTNQELAASILAVGLGLKDWHIGEKIGTYTIVKIPEGNSYGLLMMDRITGPEQKMTITELDDYLSRLNNVGYLYRAGWRYPYSDELERMIEYKDVLGLRNAYWAEDSPSKGVYYVVNFQNRENPISKSKQTKRDYYSILVKEF